LIFFVLLFLFFPVIRQDLDGILLPFLLTM
jgi:hypothetical protein